MTKINVIIQDKNWKKYIKNYSLYLNKKIKVLDTKINLFQKNNLVVTILLSGNQKIKYLNKYFRGKNKATDILSFPSYEGKQLEKILKNKNQIYLGDIIININKIKKDLSKHNFKITFDKLWIHGLIHLFGFSHKKDKDFIKMSKIEKKCFSHINHDTKNN